MSNRDRTALASIETVMPPVCFPKSLRNRTALIDIATSLCRYSVFVLEFFVLLSEVWNILLYRFTRFFLYFNKCVTLMHELALIDLRIENDIACIEVKEKS